MAFFLADHTLVSGTPWTRGHGDNYTHGDHADCLNEEEEPMAGLVGVSAMWGTAKSSY
jgi:hypothetical protein